MHTALAIGTVLALLHLIVVVAIVLTIVKGIEGDWPLYWFVLVWLDLPFSLVFVVIGKAWYRADARRISVPWLPNRVNDLDNFVLPFFFLGIGGTLWWFLLPQFIGKLIEYAL